MATLHRAALAALVLAVAVLALPGAASAAPRHSKLPAAERRAIQHTLERFVVSAVARSHELRSWKLVTPQMRSGLTRADWAAGNIPVYPYPARGTGLDGWTVGAFSRDRVSFDVLLHAAAHAHIGPIAYTVRMRKLGGRWLIDSFTPTAQFAAAGATPSVYAEPDLAPSQSTSASTSSRLGGAWLVGLVAVLVALVMVPAVLVARVTLRDRGPRQRGTLPPLPRRAD